MEYTKKMTIAEIVNHLFNFKDFEPCMFSADADENKFYIYLMDICGKVKCFSYYTDFVEEVDIWHIIEVLDNTGWTDEDLDGDLANLKWQEIGTDGEYHQYGVNFEN